MFENLVFHPLLIDEHTDNLWFCPHQSDSVQCALYTRGGDFPFFINRIPLWNKYCTNEDSSDQDKSSFVFFFLPFGNRTNRRQSVAGKIGWNSRLSIKMYWMWIPHPTQMRPDAEKSSSMGGITLLFGCFWWFIWPERWVRSIVRWFTKIVHAEKKAQIEHGCYACTTY